MRSRERELWLSKVKKAANIVQIIKKYIPLEMRGHYWGSCPFHESKVPTLSVEETSGFFYCFKCHTGGDVFSFVSRVEKISYLDAARKLAKEYGLEDAPQ